ncbi:flavin reductase family protein [Mesorhizobium sp. BR1-1-16]|uniref:flavin reductase family protein n=1 Tax=Mesorhizobium sp. BR1-1-16 TaxID=2876653 RepID=UPI001CCA090B|nr:flavin reductase family protein [Mesorhizobium sp. BR1-1-16]MBZ9935729.1 flavin reductase family protein [Mesorhizobium sp. BR1-1-16]
MTSPVDPTDFRRACSFFPTGVAVVTTHHGDVFAGMTINSFASVSLQPPLVLWSIRENARSRAIFEGAGRFAVNVLSSEQMDEARHFSKHTLEAFDGEPMAISERGLPLLPGALVHLECETRAIHDGGDHRIMVGEVVALSAREGDPLIFFNGRLSAGFHAFEKS